MAEFAQPDLVETMSGVLFKRRPTNMMASAIAGAGWKTRHCTLVGTLFSWAESESSETLGYCEMLGAECDGKAMHAGGSDQEAPPTHYLFKVTPKKENGKPMELKAPTVGDVRQWVKALQNASKGIVPEQTKPTPAVAEEQPASSLPVAAAAAAAPADETAAAAAPAEAPAASKWMKVATEAGEPYYYDEISGTTSWDIPPGFVE